MLDVCIPGSLMCMYMLLHLLEWCYAPEGGGRINRNTTTKGVIKCLLPLLGELLSNPRACTDN